MGRLADAKKRRPPEEQAKIDGMLMQNNTYAFPCTDLGNSERFIKQYGDDIRYCPQLRSWFIWNGQYWREDQSNYIEHLAGLAVRNIPREADAFKNGDHQREALLKWAIKSESRDRIKAMVDLAKNNPAVITEPEDFDRDSWLLNLQNGTLNLESGSLRKHQKEDMLSKIAPVKCDSKATCPQWEKFLDKIFHGNQSLKKYIQKVAGYCLTGVTKEQDFYLLYGTGANGKSSFVNTLMAMLGGDYAKQTAAAALLVKTHESAGEEIAVLRGARLVCTIEIDEGKKLAESLVKQLSGGDKIRVRRLYANSFEFEPSFKILMACNHRPRILGMDPGIWRRIKLIPFTVSIPEQEQDLDLGEKLKTELSGILNWALTGCLEWQRNGLRPPEEVEAATTSYRVESDSIGNFLDECVVTSNSSARVQAKALYEAYKKWTEKSGEYPLSMRRFGDRLKERGFVCRASTDNLKFWTGIGLVAESLGNWGDIGREIDTS